MANSTANVHPRSQNSSPVTDKPCFAGKTVFVGGQYGTDEEGRRDAYETPYSRFGIQEMSGVEVHANLFYNARDQLWFGKVSPATSALWCVPLALLALLIIRWRRPVLNSLIALGGGILLSALAILVIWNSAGLFSWLVPLAVQLPLVVGLQGALLLLPESRLFGLLQRKSAIPGPLQEADLAALEVFISFSEQDLEFAAEVCAYLNNNGRRAWIYKDNVPPGADWLEYLGEVINSCQMVVFLLSKDSLTSLCMEELQVAKKRRKPVLAVVLDDSPIQDKHRLLIGSTQRLNATSQPRNEVLRDVLAAVERLSTKHDSGGL